MDTSETYIKMWTAAGFTEAPRQDQLQEMMGEFPNVLEELYNELWTEDCGMQIPHWASLSKHCPEFHPTRQAYWRFTSMEQLWLAFVMKGYNKVWTDEEWRIDD